MSYKKVYDGGSKLTGYWTATLTGPDGQVKQHVEGWNTVVETGKEFLASFLNSAATAAATFVMRYIAIGTDSTSAAVSNTALGTESARVSGLVSYSSGAIYDVVATFGTGVGTGAIVEYGLFNTSTGGTMMSRDVEDVINKGANDTLTVTTRLTFS